MILHVLLDFHLITIIMSEAFFFQVLLHSPTEAETARCKVLAEWWMDKTFPAVCKEADDVDDILGCTEQSLSSVPRPKGNSEENTTDVMMR
jgi:hypothetical protein